MRFPIWWLIFRASEVRNESISRRGCAPIGCHERFRSGCLPANCWCRQGSLELADVLWELPGSAFLSTHSNQSAKCSAVEACLDLPDAELRHRRDDADSC